LATATKTTVTVPVTTLQEQTVVVLEMSTEQAQALRNVLGHVSFVKSLASLQGVRDALWNEGFQFESNLTGSIAPIRTVDFVR
jgi:hypothetical protein